MADLPPPDFGRGGEEVAVGDQAPSTADLWLDLSGPMPVLKHRLEDGTWVSVPQPVADKNRAETFAESDLTLTHDVTEVAGEAVTLQAATQARTGAAEDSATPRGDGDAVGVVVEVKQTVDRLIFDPFPSTTTGGPYEFRDHSDGTLVGSGTLGDPTTVSGPIDPGEYRMVYSDVGFDDLGYSDGTTFPVEGALVDLEHGYDNAEAGRHWTFRSVTAEIDDGTQMIGTVHVEWPMPDDVYAWDVAQFQATEDGETISIYIEEETSPGTWEELAGPISRGDRIEGHPENNIRYRVEFARSTHSNDPELGAIYRRWKL